MKEVKRYLDNRIGEYSFYFEDLSSNYVYGFNENVVMTAAGCMKLPVAIALLKSVENGTVNLKERVKISGEDMVFGNGIIHEFSERDYSIGELMIAMLIQSDNTAANKIIDILGMQNINGIIQNMGLTNTILNRKTISNNMKSSGIENLTSSQDLSLCWKILYKASFLGTEKSTMLIDTLKRQQIKNKIAFYMPEDVRLNTASKSGDLDCIENDTALMLTTKGNYIFTIMSKNLPNNLYGIVTLFRSGKMIWDIINNSFSYSESQFTTI